MNDSGASDYFNAYQTRSWYEINRGFDPIRLKSTGAPSAICLDRFYDAAAVGFADGSITTYDVFDLLTPYSCFKAHSSRINTIKSLGNGSILSISDKSVAVHDICGAPKVASTLRVADSKNVDKDSLVWTSVTSISPDYFLLGNASSVHGSSLYSINISRLNDGPRGYSLTTKKFHGASYDHGISSLCRVGEMSVACGNMDGRIGLVDMRQSRMAAACVAAHSGRVTDMDVFDRTLISCGKSKDGVPEPVVKIFDLRRTARPIGVVRVPASSVKFLPGSDASAMLMSPFGQFRIYKHIDSGSSVVLGQICQVSSDSAKLCCMDISSTGCASVFCDENSGIHLWTDEPWVDPANFECQILNMNSHQLEDRPVSSTISLDPHMSDVSYWSDEYINTVNQSALLRCNVGMSEVGYFGLPEFSVFPRFCEKMPLYDFMQREIRQKVLSQAQIRQGSPGAFVETKRHEFSLNISKESKSGKPDKRAYIFASEARRTMNRSGGVDSSITSLSDAILDSFPSSGSSRFAENNDNLSEVHRIDTVPPARFQPPKAIGNFDFDFVKMNPTAFAGLEGHLLNSYANSVMQALFFCEKLMISMLGYIDSNDCSLATECGFLFEMLSKSHLMPVSKRKISARNFLRAFRHSSTAKELGLIEPTDIELDARICTLFRFILEQIGFEQEKFKELVRSTFGVVYSITERWHLSRNQDQSETPVVDRVKKSVVVDLCYPEEVTKALSQGASLPKTSFSSILLRTFKPSPQQKKLWSMQAKQRVPVVVSQTLRSLSDILVLNAAAGMSRDTYAPIFRQGDNGSKFVPASFNVAIPSNPSGKVKVSTDDLNANEGKVYRFELWSVLSYIRHSDNVIAHIRIAPYYTQKVQNFYESQPNGLRVTAGDWVLFNDLCVSKSSLEEAIDFESPWRYPAIFLYRRAGTVEEHSCALSPLKYSLPSDCEIFSVPPVNGRNQSIAKKPAICVDKIPGEGDIVAIDCEMVMLSKEESYVDHSGRKVVTRPPESSLARVSCVLEDESVLMDDYIHTKDKVVDYVTRFSGLVHGDLDPASSQHNLVSLRTTYLRLYRLVQKGCIFLGHGLSNDFDVLNLFVPQSQILDTVHLFHLPKRRYLSLALLSKYFLSSAIQQGVHDSVEDAFSALRLYKKYLELKQNGTFDETMNRVYSEAAKHNYQNSN